jgi:hypothetical protein
MVSHANEPWLENLGPENLAQKAWSKKVKISADV